MQTQPLLRDDFCDLAYVKGVIVHRKTWPTVLLHARTSAAHRPDILGPLSIFTTRAGEGYCAVEAHTTSIRPGVYFLANEGQSYTLDLETPAEVFNIHVSQDVVSEAYRDLTTPSDRLLDDPARPAPSVCFFNRLYPQDVAFQQKMAALFAAHQAKAEPLAVMERLYGLLIHLLEVHRGVLREVARLPQLRAATRAACYQRIQQAVSYIHAHVAEPLTLDTLAQVACLSRFHFLRLFKAVMRCTPQQYRNRLRAERAAVLLRETRTPVTEIALTLGYQSLSAFSRAFFREWRCWPQHYRTAVA